VSGSQLFGIALLVFGIVSMTFANTFAVRAHEFQRSFFRTDVGVSFLRFGYLMAGAVFVLIGALALAGVVEFGK
jgi:hypothetical protein